jgi:hypothetical protein
MFNQLSILFFATILTFTEILGQSGDMVQHRSKSLSIDSLNIIQNYGQRIILQHRFKEKKHKHLSSNKDYTFITNKGEFFDYKIVGFNDTLLVIKNYQLDSTMIISFNDILLIKRNWFEMNWLKKNEVLAECLAWTIFMSAVALICTPIVWITSGGDVALNVLEGVGVVGGISGILILPGLLKTKYDLANKWKIEIGKE